METPTFFKPLVERLPPDLRLFMDAGGWVVVVAVGGLILLVIMAAFLRRLFRKPRRPAKKTPILDEELASYPPPPALWGEQRLTIYGLPVRLRLVVVAPLGYEAGEITPDQVEAILGLTLPGLGQMVRADKPRIRVWPTQMSYQGFFAAFRRHTLLPDPENQLSRWVLAMGRTFFERRPLVIGLVLLADQETPINRVALEQPHQWVEAMRVVTRS